MECLHTSRASSKASKNIRRLMHVCTHVHIYTPYLTRPYVWWCDIVCMMMWHSMQYVWWCDIVCSKTPLCTPYLTHVHICTLYSTHVHICAPYTPHMYIYAPYTSHMYIYTPYTPHMYIYTYFTCTYMCTLYSIYVHIYPLYSTRATPAITSRKSIKRSIEGHQALKGIVPIVAGLGFGLEFRV